MIFTPLNRFGNIFFPFLKCDDTTPYDTHLLYVHNVGLLPKKTYYCVPKFNFNKVYEVIIPSREDWKRRRHRIADTINIFTYGSKLNNQIGGAVYSAEMGICNSLRLPDKKR